MDDPSITKRLIDFGTDEHEYDEVQELPDESVSNQQSQLHTGTTSNNNSSSSSNNNNSTNVQPATALQAAQPPPATVTSGEKLAPELPPPKQKSVKNSKKSKSKSKIPRSPSLASSHLSAAISSHNSSLQQSQAIPPQTPPLPVNFQSKAKHMNGSTTATPIASGSTATTADTSTTTATPTTIATPLALNSNNVGGIIANNNNNSMMGGGVQVNSGAGVGSAVGGVGANGANNRGSLNMASSRRPQIQISPIAESPKHFQFLTLTVRKDENGYGMKVSGDNPVFVESVKPGGAAQIAGLVAGDMILKVNGQEVRSEKHPTVVNLIKASLIVELAVKRSHKMARPNSIGIVPTTPILSGRDRTASITGPQPVDSIKRREMETYKIQTLQKMLEQEKLNLERLKGDTSNPSYKLSEANIRKLREQLRQVGAEDAPPVKYQPTANNKNIAMLSPNQLHHHLSASYHHNLNHSVHHQHQATTPQPQPQSSPAFLSLLPRSLSSLSLGTRKAKIDKDAITSPLNNTTDFLHTSTASPMSQSLHQSHLQPLPQHRNAQQQIFYQQQQQLQQLQQQQQLLQQRLKETSSKLSSSSNSKNKNKFAAQAKNLIQEDVPPPLPQRNPPRQLQLDASNNNNNSSAFSPISDLDHTHVGGMQRNVSPQPAAMVVASPLVAVAPASALASSSQKKRSKTKTKALSDPKMSTQMFLQMETAGAGGLECGGIFDGDSELDCVPPPLPPRQPGMMEESQALLKGSFQNLCAASANQSSSSRPPPNSIENILNYPLVATCTAVQRDNMSAAFPLSQRPNIVQQLQQHQQQQQQQQQLLSSSGCGQTVALGQTPHNVNHMNRHRRVVSSPENMHPRHPDRHHKTTSGTWELVEKDGEVTPPGTPPPPYLTAHSASMSGMDDPLRETAGTPTGGIFVESHHFVGLAAGAGAVSPSHISSGAHSSRIQAAQSNASQKEIISMEDEDASDQDGPFIDENGPFNYLQRLLEAENVAFLAVFLNFVLSNSEPAPLLFYLITGLYKEGTAKDMRKWAYEIHSTFLVPRAPLAWYRQDESLAREVDNVLQSEFDKVEILRKVFWKSRKRARDIICEQLREFQQKRTAGLGTIYGPTDAQLNESKGDKQREQHIFEETLLQKLHILIDEYDKDQPIEDAKKAALCSALSTVIHRIFITRSHPNSIIDRMHHFVSREKSFKSRLMGKNRKMIVRGHPLVLHQYYEVTHCNHCQTIIWGVSPQGYHCTDCKLNIHRPCSKVLDENCPGPLPQAKRKDPHNDNKISKFMGKIRPRTSSDFIAAEKRARHEEDFDAADLNSERLHSTSIVRQPSDRRPDAGNISVRSNGNAAHNHSDLQSSFHASPTDAGCADGATLAASGAAGGPGVPAAAATIAAAMGADTIAQDAADSKDARRERLHQQHQQNKSAPVSVNRSESYKERLSHKRNRNSRRKTSDPSLTSRQNDEAGLSNSNYTASSNSSLSSGGGSESPSTSMEQVGVGAVAAAAVAATPQPHHSATHGHHAPHHTHQHSHQDSFHSRNFESAEEDDLNEVDWSSNVAAEVLAALTDAEKKRQEIINEIYQTERSHVRTLKLLERVFFYPLQESNMLSIDDLKLLFPPAMLSLRDLHGAFEQKLKQRRLEHNHVVCTVGDLLASMFDGQPGDELCEFAAQFCARQQIALEALKERRRKDEQLQKILSKAEAHKACRRLQLKDLLPTVLHRFTKYPLLFENLYKVTIRVVPHDTAEAEAIQRALESSKKILVDVNQAVKTAEDSHKLQNIQRKLDKSTFDKDEFKNLDLTQYRLIHDGSLTMKKNPSIQLHGLLFENMIVLLTKQDDKYSLKYLHAARNTEVNNKPVSPIMNIDSETLVRQEAADKNSFFLIKTKTSQMLELRAPSSSECKTWFKHISDAAEQYKPRSKNASHEPVDDPAIATLPHSNIRESIELTPERPPPLSATATVTTTPLAPMLPIATATAATFGNNVGGSGSADTDVQLRNGRRESTPTPVDKQRLGQQQELSSVNRTMSTRSCGESMTSYGGGGLSAGGTDAAPNGVTLRHTQSARSATTHTAVATASTVVADGAGGSAGTDSSSSKRNSASIVYSNNSNNTRTLMQSSALVEPTAIQISISPAHTAVPVLTPAERLRRLDASIRDGLLEKQMIICDMFRLPVEHFHEIVDIAAMPEAPKDSADIALAAYAQVQSLTEVLNDYMHVTPEQEISAVSTAVCDQCHEKQQQQRPLTPLGHGGSIALSPSATTSSTSSSASSSSSGKTQIAADRTTAGTSSSGEMPPPLPPPNKPSAQTAQPQTSSTSTPVALHEPEDIHEDDDGYCEIDELRLPALPNAFPSSAALAPSSKAASPPPPLPPPAGTFKMPPPPPPLPSAASAATAAATVASNAGATPELIKRQSTISADSIPEESADEVTKAMGDEHNASEMIVATPPPSKEICVENDANKDSERTDDDDDRNEDDGDVAGKPIKAVEADATAADKKYDDLSNAKMEEGCDTESGVDDGSGAAEQLKRSAQSASAATLTGVDEPSSLGSSEHIEINDAYDTLATLNNLNNALAMVDGMTQTVPMAALMATMMDNGGLLLSSSHCGPNRLQHANALQPSVPCHALYSIVGALNSQISLLLPKINERDMERERLRKENQHLRELLNAMHERQRVEAKLATPIDITTKANASDDIDGSISSDSNAAKKSATQPAPAATSICEAEN